MSVTKKFINFSIWRQIMWAFLQLSNCKLHIVSWLTHGNSINDASSASGSNNMFNSRCVDLYASYESGIFNFILVFETFLYSFHFVSFFFLSFFFHQFSHKYWKISWQTSVLELPHYNKLLLWLNAVLQTVNIYQVWIDNKLVFVVVQTKKGK